MMNEYEWTQLVNVREQVNYLCETNETLKNNLTLSNFVENADTEGLYNKLELYNEVNQNNEKYNNLVHEVNNLKEQMSVFSYDYETFKNHNYKRNVNHFMKCMDVKGVTEISDEEFNYMNSKLVNNPYYMAIANKVSFTTEDQLMGDMKNFIRELDEYVRGYFESTNGNEEYTLGTRNNKHVLQFEREYVYGDTEKTLMEVYPVMAEVLCKKYLVSNYERVRGVDMDVKVYDNRCKYYVDSYLQDDNTEQL
jgi:hypothetical protein